MKATEGARTRRPLFPPPCGTAPPPWRPPFPPPRSQQGAPLLPSSQLLSSLSGELTMASHGASSPAMAACQWRAPTNVIFLCEKSKTDAHDLPLAIPASILSETNSNLRILRDFVFKRNSDFISNSNFNPSRLLPHPNISLGAPPPSHPTPISPKHKP
jgi:hypothetical protein